MAITRTWEDVFAAVSFAYKRTLDPVVQEYAANSAIAKMWNAFDWRGTQAALPPFWLVPYEQDYGAPFYAVPSDFGRIVEAAVVDVQNAEPCRYPPLKVVSNLQLTAARGFPTAIAFKPDTESFRVFPAVETGLTSPNWLIDGIYKKRPPKVVRSGLGGNALLWDDQYFDTFCHAYLWAVKMAAGNIQDLAAQEALFRAMLAEATAQEQLEQGDPQIYPDEALESNYGGNADFFIR